MEFKRSREPWTLQVLVGRVEDRRIRVVGVKRGRQAPGVELVKAGAQVGRALMPV